MIGKGLAGFNLINLQEYRSTEFEAARTADLVRIVPRNRTSILDIGARDGHVSKLLTPYFEKVVALDLKRPGFDYPGIETIGGDVTDLPFPDNSFDCVLCAEVLEHIPDLQQACREIARVARHEAIIGVPFKQETRIGRTTCRACGKVSPQWGHLNSFDQEKLQRLFAGLTPSEVSFVETTRAATNSLSVLLMDLADNPWGTYDQDEPCVHCGAELIPPTLERSFWSKACSAVAARLNAIQELFTPPHANWIHVVFCKTSNPSP